MAYALNGQSSDLGIWRVFPVSAQSEAVWLDPNRVYRLYRKLELNLRIKPRKWLVRYKSLALTVPSGINEVWSLDFMHDVLDDGRALQLFNVLDDFNHEALSIEIDFSLPSERVIRELDQLIQWRGRPSLIRCKHVQSTSVRPRSAGGQRPRPSHRDHRAT